MENLDKKLSKNENFPKMKMCFWGEESGSGEKPEREGRGAEGARRMVAAPKAPHGECRNISESVLVCAARISCYKKLDFKGEGKHHKHSVTTMS